MMKKKNLPMMIAWILIIVGALNWGLVGIFNFNLVSAIFGDMTVLSRIIYILVGVSAVWMIIDMKGGKCCGAMCPCGNGACKGECVSGMKSSMDMKKDMPAQSSNNQM
jgi:uncharacterized membrane protein YuzA (DUF378 family)